MSLRFQPNESVMVAVVNTAAFANSSLSISKNADVNPPKPVEIGVVSIKPCESRRWISKVQLSEIDGNGLPTYFCVVRALGERAQVILVCFAKLQRTTTR